LLDWRWKIGVYGKLKLDKFARAGNRAGLFRAPAGARGFTFSHSFDPEPPQSRGRPIDSTIQRRRHQMQFEKGQSGNPAGRAPGSKNRSTLMAQALLEGEAEELLRIAVKMAREGDSVALRLCLDRIAPRLRPRDDAIAFELPQINTVADLLPALSAIAAGVASGDLTAEQAGHLTQLVHRWTEAVQVVDFDARLRKLEEAQGGNHDAGG
jgi:hypothetical protein